jgi:hypothetical protein
MHSNIQGHKTRQTRRIHKIASPTWYCMYVAVKEQCRKFGSSNQWRNCITAMQLKILWNVQACDFIQFSVSDKLEATAVARPRIETHMRKCPTR